MPDVFTGKFAATLDKGSPSGEEKVKPLSRVGHTLLLQSVDMSA